MNGDVKCERSARDNRRDAETVQVFKPPNFLQLQGEKGPTLKWTSTSSFAQEPSSGHRSKTNRLAAVEGVRAYLAFWVLICHVLWAAGYQAGKMSGLPRLLREGHSAVD